MTQFLLVLAVALTLAAIVFGVTVLVTGDDAGLAPAEPDGIALPLPGDRPLTEADLQEVRFDAALRGYRMAQVDAALRRAAYDVGYKDELIKVLQAEVDALREGRVPEAEALRRAREAALAPASRARPAGSPDTSGAAASPEPSPIPPAPAAAGPAGAEPAPATDSPGAEPVRLVGPDPHPGAHDAPVSGGGTGSGWR